MQVGGAFPESWNQVDVVAIFKKGSALLLGNYRPISLLNLAYKIYARVLAARLITIVGPRLRSTHYGFRHSSST
eukprot:9558844-Alexandrium_andersonii.AAC.1